MLRYYPHPSMMLHPEMSRRIRGGLSDHAIKFFNVSVIIPINETLFTISGLTYNLMMKCAGLEYGVTANRSRFANNPLLITENDAQYVYRKILQINRLLHLIFSRKLDYVFLQEADFFSIRPQDSEVLQQHKAWLIHGFTSALARKDYTFIYHPRSAQYSQDLVTIYLTTVFNLNLDAANQPILQSEHSRRYRAFQCFLTHIQTGMPISLINMHLNYDDNYMKNNVLSNTLSAHNMITVMGGDANRRPGVEMPYLFNDNTPTTICYQKDAQGNPVMVDDSSALYIQNAAGETTAYDGICAFAPALYYVKVKTCGGEIFELQHNGTIQVRFSDSQGNSVENQSLPGTPYRNEKFEIIELDAKLGMTHQTLEEKRMCAELITSLLMMRENRKGYPPTQLITCLHHYRKYMQSADDDSNEPSRGHNIKPELKFI